MVIKNLNVNKSIDVVVSIDGKQLAGQAGATLVQNTATIEITNQIEPDWETFLPGTRSWKIRCNGLYVISASTLDQLEKAFLNNQTVDISFTLAGKEYHGEAILVDFPLSATFSKGLTYSAQFLGSGPLS